MLKLRSKLEPLRFVTHFDCKCTTNIWNFTKCSLCSTIDIIAFMMFNDEAMKRTLLTASRLGGGVLFVNRTFPYVEEKCTQSAACCFKGWVANRVL